MNYNQDWLDRYKNPENRQRFKADYQVKMENSSCGDQLEMMVDLDHKQIIKARFDGRGCVMSTVSADMLCEYIENKHIKEVLDLDEKNWIERFPDLSPGRYNCVLLALRAVKEILNGSQ